MRGDGRADAFPRAPVRAGQNPEGKMKGIVFNVLEEVVSEGYGADTWDALLTAAGCDGAYTSLGSYPDGEFMRLAASASDLLGMPSEELLRWFGRLALPRFAERYPALFAEHHSARPFVLTLNDIIHPEVRKLYPGAEVPDFEFDASSADRLVIRYRSSRKLCAFAVGLIQGAAAYYGERVTVEQPECMKQGAAECVLVCAFETTASR
jgi:hypothetical protein